jgi:subtilisin family serine protease
MLPRLLPLLAVAALALGALGLPQPALAAPGPVVAVVDSGVDVSHPALRGHAVPGADFVDGDDRPDDPRGHGTHIAGLIARKGGGKRLGKPTGARIMPLRVIDTQGTGSTAALVSAIAHAIDHGARIINLSIAHYEPDPALAAVLQRAADAGVLVVAAAGNDGEDLDRVAVYPASFHTPSMIVVAATELGVLAPWSARGSRTVDIAAPGNEVRSSLPRGRYGRRSGTSQATALVSRAAAVLWRSRPAATAAEIRAALVGGARPTADLRGAVTGGRLDVRGALGLLG